MKKSIFARLGALIGGLLIAVSSFAQTYPWTTPTYMPNAIMAATTYTGTGTTTAFQINGVSNLVIGVQGTFSALSMQLQVTESRGSSPTWVNLPVDSYTGDRFFSIAATGNYHANVAGYAQARLNIVTLTGTNVIVGMAAGAGDGVIGNFNVYKHTFSATVTGLSPAASATDFFTITGSASAIVRVTHVECSGQATSSSSKLIQLQQRITPDSGGTSSVVAATPNDYNDYPPTAVVTSYTANPTLGTATSGVARAGILNLPVSTAIGTPPLSWDFGAQTRNAAKEMVLRNASQVLAVHGAGASFPSGSVVNCDIEWVEE
jgi:hypothetical protein